VLGGGEFDQKRALLVALAELDGTQHRAHSALKIDFLGSGRIEFEFSDSDSIEKRDAWGRGGKKKVRSMGIEKERGGNGD
jgi:hypothetical protein